jgi:hypothetical protein
MAYRNSLKLALLGAVSLGACSTVSPTPAAQNKAGVSPEVYAIHQRFMTLDTHLDTPAFLDTVRGYDIMEAPLTSSATARRSTIRA